MNQIEYANYDRKTWSQLHVLLEQGKILEWHKLYLDYLKNSDILSNSRKILYFATLETIKILEKVNNETKI